MASGEPGNWVHRPDWSVVRVAGADAAVFLHNLATNDVKGLPPGEARETLFTDVKGKVVAHALLCRQASEGSGGEVIDVVVTSPRAHDLAVHLDKYHIREALTLEANPPGVLIAVGNDKANFPSNSTAYALPALGEGVQLALLNDDDADELTAESLDSPGFVSLRVAKRFPVDAVDVDSSHLPQELNRDAQLISFTKGCYLGQETVARIDALGRVNRLLVRLRWQAANAEPQAGDELRIGDKTVGRVGSVAREESATQPIAMAYVRREQAAEGSTVESAAGAATVY